MTNSRKPRWLVVFGAIAISAFWVQHSRANAPPNQYEIKSGTVRDTKSLLTWEQVPSAPESIHVSAQVYCSSLSLDGGGWRLPSMKELMTIVDETRTNPAIDTTAFPNTPSVGFWTSSSRLSKGNHIWYVDFSIGDTGSNDPFITNLRVRCVR